MSEPPYFKRLVHDLETIGIIQKGNQINTHQGEYIQIHPGGLTGFLTRTRYNEDRFAGLRRIRICIEDVIGVVDLMLESRHVIEYDPESHEQQIIIARLCKLRDTLTEARRGMKNYTETYPNEKDIHVEMQKIIESASQCLNTIYKFFEGFRKG